MKILLSSLTVDTRTVGRFIDLAVFTGYESCVCVCVLIRAHFSTVVFGARMRMRAEDRKDGEKQSNDNLAPNSLFSDERCDARPKIKTTLVQYM